jgi:hypothetical protein
MTHRFVQVVSAILVMAISHDASAYADDLPSWNDGAAKQSIVDFVTAVTTEGGPDYVAPADRVATFDNDGCLWSEQPMYVQLHDRQHEGRLETDFSVDRIVGPINPKGGTGVE